MALILKQTYNTGFEADYLSIQQIQVNKEAGTVVITFSVYKDKTARNADKVATSRFSVSAPFEAVKNTKDDVTFAACYTYCKTLPQFEGSVDG